MPNESYIAVALIPASSWRDTTLQIAALKNAPEPTIHESRQQYPNQTYSQFPIPYTGPLPVLSMHVFPDNVFVFQETHFP